MDLPAEVAAFLAAALVCLAIWIYWRFFYVATLTLALQGGTEVVENIELLPADGLL